MAKTNDQLINPTNQILLLFIVAQFLALIVGKIMIDNQNEATFQALSMVPEEPGSPGNVIYLIMSVLIAAALLVIIMMLPIRDVLIRFLEFLASVISMIIVFFVIFYALNIENADALSIMFGLIFYIARMTYSPFRNVVAVIASAGVGALIGFSIDPLPTVLFVILIAVYDMIAVWWTGHMVQFAKHFISMQTTFTIGAEGVKEIVTRKKGKLTKTFEPVRLELGTGDLAIPAALIVSVYKLGNFVFPLMTFIGAVIGLYFILKRAQEEKRVFPAMPSIAVSSIIMLMFTFLALAVLNML